MMADAAASTKPVALAAIAATCVAVAVLLAVTGIEGSRGSCGTLLSPGWAEDAATDAACSNAYGQRRVIVALLLVAGVLAAGFAGAAFRRRGRNYSR